jgi:hypothetical protein
MTAAEIAVPILHRLAALPLRTRVLLALATTVFVIELLLRRFAPDSVFYRRWKAAFEAVGRVWTAVILAIVYFLSVSVVSALLKILGKDPLDRSLRAEPSYWRAHEPNPLGPLGAARHQF